MSRREIAAARIFDGERFHDHAALEIAEGRVVGIRPGGERDDGVTLAPGFVDWQVNGGGGVMLNDDPSPAAIRAIAAAHARFGTTALLPTLISDAADKTAAALAAVQAAIAENAPGIVGGHLEGPHLARAGAHDPAMLRPMTEGDLARLAAPRRGVRLVTVAPEMVTPEQIAALAEASVIVSLGHSDAGYDAAMAAFDAGATAVTHLFNAMSPFGHRAPGLAGAALDRNEIWCGLIADGWHVHPAALRLALKAKPGRAALVTDAMATVGAKMDGFILNGRQVTRRDGRLTLADGSLAGADIDMAAAVRFMVREVGAPLAEALRMASLHPARMLGLDGDRGHLRPGARADVVALDADLKPLGTWIGGEAVAG